MRTQTRMKAKAMATPAAEALRFSKMHGAGNDFVVIDLRDGRPPPDAALAARLAHRHFGVGCDQILTIQAPRSADAVAAYAIWNADGSASGQCGNGARCVAAWLVRDGAARGPRFVIDSPAGRHEVDDLGDGRFAIAMGVPRFEPVEVPLAGFDSARPQYTLDLDGLGVEFGAVSMGNPHAVIEVADVEHADVAGIGARLQRSPAFPQSCNVGFAQVLAPDRLRLRVYERGVGETLACGSGACAAVVALVRRGRLAREVVVELPGGQLQIHWPGDGAEVIMAGPAAFVFEGEWQHE